jgi:hypothetical protein
MTDCASAAPWRTGGAWHSYFDGDCTQVQGYCDVFAGITYIQFGFDTELCSQQFYMINLPLVVCSLIRHVA